MEESKPKSSNFRVDVETLFSDDPSINISIDE